MNGAIRDAADDVAWQVPAGRVGMSEDIADIALYPASCADNYALGSTIPVDGGPNCAR